MLIAEKNRHRIAVRKCLEVTKKTKKMQAFLRLNACRLQIHIIRMQFFQFFSAIEICKFRVNGLFLAGWDSFSRNWPIVWVVFRVILEICPFLFLIAAVFCLEMHP